jgi:Transposase DDE domain
MRRPGARRAAKVNPEIGRTVAIDGSEMPAYANGQRYVSRGRRLRERFSDPDASLGHRSSISTRSGGAYYGYKIHAAVCTTSGLPLTWKVETAKDAEAPAVPVLLDRLRDLRFPVEHAVLDKAYDVGPVYEDYESRRIRPIVPVRKTPAVLAGKHQPPSCEHGTWTFAGLTPSATRPSGAARPASASPHPGGPRRTGCTSSSAAAPTGSGRSTGSAPPSSGSSVGSSTNGDWRRCASGGSSGSGCTPT